MACIIMILMKRGRRQSACVRKHNQTVSVRARADPQECLPTWRMDMDNTASLVL